MAASTDEHDRVITRMADRFWYNSRREWTRALYSPFFVVFASGKLKGYTYYNFLAQERYFLQCVDHVLGLAEEYADELHAKVSIRLLRKHESFKERVRDLITTYPKGPLTVKYTDFLMATGTGKIEGVKYIKTPFEKSKLAAYTLGAIMPWLQLYAYLGKQLQTLVDANALMPWKELYPYVGKELKKEIEIESFACGSTHPHKDWIDLYASDSFQVCRYETEDLLDKLSVSLTGEEPDIIQMLYNRSMKLMLDFFYAQPVMQYSVVPLLDKLNLFQRHHILFSGFEFTCSVVNSSAILAEIAKAKEPKSNQVEIDQMILANMTDTRGLLCREFTEEYKQFINNILLAEERTRAREDHDEYINRILRTGKAKKFDYIALKKVLEQLSKFEKDANTRVFESGVLKGLNREDIKRTGERLVLRDGCISLFQSIIENERSNASMHVLSNCWCKDIIKSAFSSDLQAVDIHANEFVYEKSISTGEIVRKIESPIDKLERFNNIRKKIGNGGEKVIVYIGASVGDLLCLLEADIGIVIGSITSLMRVASHFGVSFVPLFHGLVRKQKGFDHGDLNASWTKKSGTLYTVSSWAEIHAFIIGL